jgi:selT/selW/selH-like putative selenoprotein
LNEQTEHKAEADEGRKGQFDVLVDGELVFSKEQSGRFPEDGEVRALLESL